MDTETKMLIDFFQLYPEWLYELRKLGTVEDVEAWVDRHEKNLIRFGKEDTWERIKFYSAVNYDCLFRWIKGEIYV